MNVDIKSVTDIQNSIVLTSKVNINESHFVKDITVLACKTNEEVLLGQGQDLEETFFLDIRVLKGEIADENKVLEVHKNIEEESHIEKAV